MASLLLLSLVALPLVHATETTWTEVQCHTYMGMRSPYAVPTHSTTITTNSPDITLAATSKPISTLTPDHLLTYNVTETSIATVVTTVTERLTDSIFSTTSTRYIWEHLFVGVTTTVRTLAVNTEQFTVTLAVPTLNGFLPINTTTSAPSTSALSMPSSASTNATVVNITTTLADGSVTTIVSTPVAVGTGTITPAAAPDNQIIYILSEGQLIPTPLSAVRSNITNTISQTTSVDQMNTAASGSTSTQSMSQPSTPPSLQALLEDPYREDLDVDIFRAFHENGFRVVPDRPAPTPPPSLEELQSLASVLGTALPEGSATTHSIIATSTTAELTSSPTPEPTFVEFDSQEPEPAPEPEPEPEPASTPFIHGTTLIASLAAEKSLIPVDLDTIPGRAPRKRDLFRRNLEPRALTRVPKRYKGMRGALTDDPSVTDRPWPTEVSCTKTYIHETTVWDASSYAPSFVHLQPVTNVVTSISTLTSTKTVPDRRPFKTESFISRATLTTTTTYEHTTTITDSLVWTRTSTSTTYHACATQNVMGPRAANESRIVNAFNRGASEYALYTIGHARNAEDCCIECQTLPTPCVGSVFAEWKCHLFTAPRSKCLGQGGAAAFYLTRPDGEKWPKAYTAPEFWLSNGPCGFFYDGGTGW